MAKAKKASGPVPVESLRHPRPAVQHGTSPPRLMAARYPSYVLVGSAEGAPKEPSSLRSRGTCPQASF